MDVIAGDGYWGSKLLRTVRAITICFLLVAILEFITLRILERQDSCVAYLELSPLMKLVLGISLAGATGVLAAIGAKLDHHLDPRRRKILQAALLVVIPVVASIAILASEYVHLIQIYWADPDVFCD